MPTRPPKHRPPGWRAYDKPAADRQRGSASSRGYGVGWRRLRAAVPPGPCVDCGAAWTSGHHLDHDRARRRGGSDDPSNLRWRCATCHSRKTARDDGGFGNPTGPGRR